MQLTSVALCKELGAELVALGSVQEVSFAHSVQQIMGFLSLLLQNHWNSSRTYRILLLDQLCYDLNFIELDFF